MEGKNREGKTKMRRKHKIRKGSVIVSVKLTLQNEKCLKSLLLWYILKYIV
jgi:hypothetical protein